MPAVLKTARSSRSTDRLRGFKYQVNINHITPQGLQVIRCGFSQMSPIQKSSAPVSYRQGGMNDRQLVMPSQTTHVPITFTRGVSVNGPELYDWVDEVEHVVQGQPIYGQSNDFKADVDIYVMAHPWPNDQVPVLLAYKVFNAWPSDYGHTGLDASQSAILLEQMALQHEGWRMSWSSDGSHDAATLT